MDAVRREYEQFMFLLQAERDRVNKANVSGEEMVTLNACGQVLKVSKTLLCSQKDSLFTAMFSGRHPLKTNELGEVVIESDPKIVKLMLMIMKN